MTISIYISNYTDTIEVKCDGNEMSDVKLLPDSKAQITINSEPGIHMIDILKRPMISGEKNNLLYQMISIWENVILSELAMDINNHSIQLEVHADEDIQIDLFVSANGFEMIGNNSAVKVLSKKEELNRNAEKKRNQYFLYPARILYSIVLILIAALGICLIINGYKFYAILVLGIELFVISWMNELLRRNPAVFEVMKIKEFLFIDMNDERKIEKYNQSSLWKKLPGNGQLIDERTICFCKNKEYRFEELKDLFLLGDSDEETGAVSYIAEYYAEEFCTFLYDFNEQIPKKKWKYLMNDVLQKYLPLYLPQDKIIAYQFGEEYQKDVWVRILDIVKKHA